jgi:hypothetical protein
MLAAGVIFITLTLEIFPVIANIDHGDTPSKTKLHNGLAVICGFVGAAVLVILLRLYLKKKIEQTPRGKLVFDNAYMAASIIDIFLSGLMMGMGLGISKVAGLPLVVASSLEISTTFLSTAKQSQKKPLKDLILYRGGYALALGVGALVGFVGVEGMGGAEATQKPGGKFILAFGAVTYAWIVVETLVRDAVVEETKCLSKEGKCYVDRNATVSQSTTALASGSFFAGVLAMVVGKWYGHNHDKFIILQDLEGQDENPQSPTTELRLASQEVRMKRRRLD